MCLKFYPTFPKLWCMYRRTRLFVRIPNAPFKLIELFESKRLEITIVANLSFCYVRNTNLLLAWVAGFHLRHKLVLISQVTRLRVIWNRFTNVNPFFQIVLEYLISKALSKVEVFHLHRNDFKATSLICTETWSRVIELKRLEFESDLSNPNETRRWVIFRKARK